MTIKVAHVNKIFDSGHGSRTQVLFDVNATFPENQISVIRGPSGCGKSTLLYLIGGLLKTTSGDVVVGGQNISNWPEHLLSQLRQSIMGFIFQNFFLIEQMTVMDNVLSPLIPVGRVTEEQKRDLQSLIAYLGMEHKWHTQVQYLSGGEHQRVCIIRALVHNPSVILADEPTAHLDSQQSCQLMDLLYGYKAKGKTLIVATHDPLVFDRPEVDNRFLIADGKLCKEI